MEPTPLSAPENPGAEDEPPQSCRSACGCAPAPASSSAGPRGRTGRFVTGPRARRYRRRFHPAVGADWHDWRWQMAHALRRLPDFERTLRLSDDERAALADGGGLPAAVPPYYAAQIDPDDPASPLRRTMIPVPVEKTLGPGEADDPLGEEHQCAAPGLVHRYPDRVLFLATGCCAAYCRYCTRSRLVGDAGHRHFGRAQWQKALAYIEATPAVRDVLVSGGDPLTLGDEPLEWLLTRLRAIPHVEVIRLGTKTPAALPMRVTPALARMLRRFHPLWMSLHFTHPDELTPETEEACARLADAGIPLGSQTVLLRGVNDDPAVMTRLNRGLMRLRVRPYYLYQCDPIRGSAHFRTPVAAGTAMIRALRGHTSGYAVPQFVVDAPGGGGKVPLLPDYTVGRDAGGLWLENYEGGRYRYPETP